MNTGRGSYPFVERWIGPEAGAYWHHAPSSRGEQTAQAARRPVVLDRLVEAPTVAQIANGALTRRSRRGFLQLGGATALVAPFAFDGARIAEAQFWPAMGKVVLGALKDFALMAAADSAQQGLTWLYRQLPWNQRQAVEAKHSATEKQQYSPTSVTNVYVGQPIHLGPAYFWGIPHSQDYSALTPVVNPQMYVYNTARYGEHVAQDVLPVLDGPTSLGLTYAAAEWDTYKSVYARNVTVQDGLLPVVTKRDPVTFPAWDATFSKLYSTGAGYVEIGYDGAWSQRIGWRPGAGQVRVRALDINYQAHFDREYQIDWL